MLHTNKFHNKLIRYFTGPDPFTNVYGLARTVLALGTLLTFLLSDVHVLFRPAVGVATVPLCQGIAGKISIFCLMDTHLELAKWIVIIILGVVVSGWRPRFTGILHWWVCYSFMNSAILVDGGDQITAILSLLLIPVTLADSRKWHWQQNNSGGNMPAGKEVYKRIMANTSLKIIRVQVAVIYLHAAIAKCYVAEWQNGTALYYWFTDPMFGISDWLKPIVLPVITHSLTVSLLTWSIVILELMLFAAIISNKKYRPLLLVFGILFHLGIGLIHGLVSFMLVMITALVLFLRPTAKIFRLPGLRFRLFKDPTAMIAQRSAWRKLMGN